MKYFNFEKKSNILTLISLGMIILFCIFLSLRGNSNTKVHSKTGFFFDTFVEISVYDSISDEKADKILEEAVLLCDKYENLFSKTKENSDIHRINDAGCEYTEISPETYELLVTARDFAKKTEGVVDPTVGQLTSLWNLKDENFTVPSDKDIQNALKHVDYHLLNFDSSTCSVSKSDPELKVDLGFIAKGYIADRLKEFLESQNINSAIINLGGNVLCIGQKADNSPFIIGIKDPLNPDTDIISQVYVCSKSVVSSGAYERNKTVDGKLYHHILSTKNGYPASSDLSQVTIINTSSTEGDALSTLCFILGYEKSKDFLKTFYPEVEAIFVDQKGNLIRD